MLPLEGIKVVDLSTWVFGPCCAAALGDWGADVIKIENPRTGDPFRWFLMSSGLDDSDMPVSLFDMNNRNKRGMAIDLKQADGLDIVYKLIEDADIFVSNIPLESLKKIEMDYPRLSAVNSRLIYVHATGYGNKGPDMNKPGFDSTAYWARSGIMSALAVGDRPPVSQQFPAIGDQASGLALFGGSMLALYNREKTGRGQLVDLSLLAMGTWVAACPIQFTLSTGQVMHKLGRHEIKNPLICYYKTKDGAWIFISCLPDAPYWTPLCKALGREDLEHDPKFNTTDNRLKNNGELICILDEILSTETRDKWGKRFDEHGIVWTKIPASFAEVVKDPQVLANDIVAEVEHPARGPVKMVNTPIRLNTEAPKIRKFAPELGQHNEEILLEMGYNREDIAKLKDKSVIT